MGEDTSARELSTAPSGAEPRPWLASLDPYVPGARAAHADGAMASNESPLGPSPAVAGAVAGAVASLHRYPDPLADRLRAALAAHHGVDPDRILVGNGSDELIYLLTHTYAAEGGSIVCADPPYRIHELAALVAHARVHRVPLRAWVHDLDAMARVDAGIAFICNPHNPSGTAVAAHRLEQFVADSRATLTVVDEAYVDFADDPARISVMPLAATGRVAVLRTFSKLYGLAGARVGYLVAPENVVTMLRTVRAPFSVSALGQAAALAALDDQEHVRAARAHVSEQRARMAALFERAGYSTVPSQANFILVEAPDEDALVARLARSGIAVRAGRNLGAPGSVRVSVPHVSGMALLEQALAPG